jgi:hypothetical protein
MPTSLTHPFPSGFPSVADLLAFFVLRLSVNGFFSSVGTQHHAPLFRALRQITILTQ